MPTIEISYCDYCNQEIERVKFLIYSISYWNNKQYKPMKKKFIMAKMFCNSQCLGLYFEKILNKEFKEK